MELSMTGDHAPYHAHIYYELHDRERARRLHQHFVSGNGVKCSANVLFVGEMRDVNVGPHPKPQFEIHFLREALPRVLAIVKASGLTALIHPLTDDDLADHTLSALWIGDPLPLDHSVLDPPGINQGIARFG